MQAFDVPAACLIQLRDRRMPHIASDQVVLLQGVGNYTRICLRNGRTMIATRTLLDFEKELAQQPFFRIHKSYLISLCEIDRFDLKSDHRVWLRNGLSFAIARRRRTEFQACINALLQPDEK